MRGRLWWVDRRTSWLLRLCEVDWSSLESGGGLKVFGVEVLVLLEWLLIFRVGDAVF